MAEFITGATILTAGGIALAAVGQIGAGNAAAAQAEGQAAVANYNAKVQEQEARSQEAQATFRQRRQAEEAARIASSLQAGLGASGAVSSEGTPLLIQAKQAAESELDNLLIGYEGQLGASRSRSQAALDRMQAGIYGQQAGYARMGGMIGAGSTLLTGFGTMAARKYGYL